MITQASSKTSVYMCVCASVTYFFHFSLTPQFFFHKHAQVPSHDHGMTPEEALRHFQQEVPALGLLGTPYHIHPDTPYTVDKEVQLVCKYLKALQVGGTRGIDRLYQEGGEIELCVLHVSYKFITHVYVCSWCSC